MSDEATREPRKEIGHLYNASQLRSDTWSNLRYLTEALRVRGSAHADSAALRERIDGSFTRLEPIETYWAFPGVHCVRRCRELLRRRDDAGLERVVRSIVRALVGGTYRRRPVAVATEEGTDERETSHPSENELSEPATERPYFEVLIVDAAPEENEDRLRDGLRRMRRREDRFIYDVIVVPSFEDAVIGVLFNPTIQTCVIHHGFQRESGKQLGLLRRYLARVESLDVPEGEEEDPSSYLARVIGELRPELDCFLVTDLSVESVAGRTPRNVRRVFYSREDWFELHLNILRAINDRYKTPFFTALRDYSVQPTGVFHALPISRGKSIIKSHWIQDMAQFYGMNIFLAETSATSGGLDSLLDPQGPIKKAQERAARAFGAQRTYFVTNGTSTANKIVLQGLIQPDDIVLVDRNCHKSHHYGFVLSGARVCYLDAYPIHSCGIYGAVPLKDIKRTLLAYRKAGELDRVKMLLLTNCTFDGIVYHPIKVMEACLAIKPDLIFHWDEAWFAFARFAPTHRRRTAMDAARRLRERVRECLRDPELAAAWAERDGIDPAEIRVRVYVTQSTHKTLTALRQGSMIHVHDQDFHSVEGSFREAYMTHTSTSPNYQILASLDLGRRQVELEGYELVSRQIELALTLREQMLTHPLLVKWFRILRTRDMVPAAHRPSGNESYYDPAKGWSGTMTAWEGDEFVLDPTRLTVFVGRTGIDGDTFKNRELMDRHGIQVNKTSRNTVLFMTNIGTTRSSVAHLIEVFMTLAEEFEAAEEDASPAERAARERAVRSLTVDVPPLPDFSRFHEKFRHGPAGEVGAGDVRTAYYLAMDEASCDYLSLGEPELDRRLESAEEPVSAAFVTPYPPGFPILVPGQVVSKEIVAFMRALDVKEIHGYRADLGLRVIRRAILEAGTAAPGEHATAT